MIVVWQNEPTLAQDRVTTLMFCPMVSVVGQVRGGNLRAIAVTGGQLKKC